MEETLIHFMIVRGRISDTGPGNVRVCLLAGTVLGASAALLAESIAGHEATAWFKPRVETSGFRDGGMNRFERPRFHSRLRLLCRSL